MKEVTVVFSNVSDQAGIKTLFLDHGNVLHNLANCLRGVKDSDIEIDVRPQPERWPQMALGDTFRFNETEFMFVSYPRKYKAKAVRK